MDHLPPIESSGQLPLEPGTQPLPSAVQRIRGSIHHATAVNCFNQGRDSRHRLWLECRSYTTHQYIEADLLMKEQALHDSTAKGKVRRLSREPIINVPRQSLIITNTGRTPDRINPIDENHA